MKKKSFIVAFCSIMTLIIFRQAKLQYEALAVPRKLLAPLEVVVAVAVEIPDSKHFSG